MLCFLYIKMQELLNIIYQGMVREIKSMLTSTIADGQRLSKKQAEEFIRQNDVSIWQCVQQMYSDYEADNELHEIATAERDWFTEYFSPEINDAITSARGL